MPAYVILINNKTTNPAELDLYRPKAVAAREGHEMTFVALGGKFEILEGAPAESVTIARFADMAAAKAWYDSPAYQDAKLHRLKGADFRILLTEGL